MLKKRKERYLRKLQTAAQDDFKQLLEEWLTHCHERAVANTTIADYKEKLGKLHWWWNKNHAETLGTHPKAITSKEAAQFVAYLKTPNENRWNSTAPRKATVLSEASVVSYGRAIRAFFNYLVKYDYIPENPFNPDRVRFTSKNKPQQTVKTMKTEDIVKVFEHLDKHRNTFTGKRDLALVGIIFDSAIRRGEALSMRVSETDLTRLRFTVSGKTGSRTAFMSEKGKDLLQDYLRAREEKFKTSSDVFWFTESGTPLTLKAVNSIVERIYLNTGVKLRLHGLRHSAASLMATKVDTFTLMQILGHKKISTTQIYINLAQDNTSNQHRQHSPLIELEDKLPSMKRKGRPRKYS